MEPALPKSLPGPGDQVDGGLGSRSLELKVFSGWLQRAVNPDYLHCLLWLEEIKNEINKKEAAASNLSAQKMENACRTSQGLQKALWSTQTHTWSRN